MEIQIARWTVTLETLTAYAMVSAASVVETRLDLGALQSPDGPRFVEVRLPGPLILDSDQHERPEAWATRDDIARWTMLRAFDGSEAVGGAIVAVRPDDHWFFPPEEGLAVLWDLRVAVGWRGQGIGRRLVLGAASFAREAGSTRLAIETQDVNAVACRLYASAGGVLFDVRPGAYRRQPDEAAVLWHIDLQVATGGGR